MDGREQQSEVAVEIRIGVQHTARELVVESAESAQSVEAAVAKALNSDERLVVLVDEKGRRVVVPTDKLAYVEIGEESARRVGFGTRPPLPAS